MAEHTADTVQLQLAGVHCATRATPIAHVVSASIATALYPDEAGRTSFLDAVRARMSLAPSRATARQPVTRLLSSEGPIRWRSS
jgi:hypothetical protein